GARAYVQFELASIYRGKEILAQPWKQQQHGSQAKAEKDQQKSALMMQTAFEPSVIAFAETLKSLFKPDLHRHQRISALARGQILCFMSAQQIFRHGGHERS